MKTAGKIFLWIIAVIVVIIILGCVIGGNSGTSSGGEAATQTATPTPSVDYSSDPVCGTWSGHYTYKSKSYEVVPLFNPDGTLDLAVDSSLGIDWIRTTWKCTETGTSRKYTTGDKDLVFYLSNDILYSSSEHSQLWIDTGVTAFTYYRVK